MPGDARGVLKSVENKFLMKFKKKNFSNKKKHFLDYVTPKVAMGSLKQISQFGPAVWQAAADIQQYIQM